MIKVWFMLLVVSCLAFFKPAFASVKGSINLDEHTFDKIIPKFDAVLVKFDAVYPFGEKHDAFNAVAQELKDSQDILIAEVGIKDFGEHDNANLAEKYGIKSKTDWPALRLFVQGEDEPFTFNNNQVWTQDEIKKFIREHSSIYLGLQGCLKKFDVLAGEFSGATDKNAVIVEAEKVAQGLKSQADRKSAATYINFMKRALDNDSFIENEKKRLTNIILKGKVKAEKKLDLQAKLNILAAFRYVTKTEL